MYMQSLFEKAFWVLDHQEICEDAIRQLVLTMVLTPLPPPTMDHPISSPSSSSIHICAKFQYYIYKWVELSYGNIHILLRSDINCMAS